jgi:hypothetical protein
MLCVANLKQVSFGLGVQKGVLVVGPVRDGVAEHEQRGVVFEHPEARLPLPQQNGARRRPGKADAVGLQQTNTHARSKMAHARSC